jgi:hypothetical protein
MTTRDVNDAQPVERQPNIAVTLKPVVVGTTVDRHLPHACQQCLFYRPLCVEVIQSVDATDRALNHTSTLCGTERSSQVRGFALGIGATGPPLSKQNLSNMLWFCFPLDSAQPLALVLLLTLSNLRPVMAREDVPLMR